MSTIIDGSAGVTTNAGGSVNPSTNIDGINYSCRAWVNFDGTAAGTFAGGTSTVSRTALSTTATITTTNDHGLITGNSVWALTGVVAGAYTVTVTGVKTFTITTAATTALAAVPITFAVNGIRASGNVSSVTDNGVGDYTVNFTTAMSDANYCYTMAVEDASVALINLNFTSFSKTTSSIRTGTRYISSLAGSATADDADSVCIAIFR